MAAHARRDKAALVGLYMQAADGAGEVDEMCFFLTHAYVFALDVGDGRAQTLKARLIDHGREA